MVGEFLLPNVNLALALSKLQLGCAAMSSLKIIGSTNRLLESFQPPVTEDESSGAEPVGELSAVQVSGVPAMGKTMHVPTPNRGIRFRQAEVKSTPAQVPRPRGGEGNGKISEFRAAVERVKGVIGNVGALNPQILAEMEGRMSALEQYIRDLEQGRQPLGDDQLEALRSGSDNLRSLANFFEKGWLGFEPEFVVNAVQFQLSVTVAKVIGETCVRRDGLRNCGEIFEILGREPVASPLERFRGKFLRGLTNSAQVEAEKRNLRHIIFCADEMLTDVEHGGLGFRLEFVARMVCARLEIAMFETQFSPSPQNVCNFWKIDFAVDAQNPDKVSKLTIKRENLRQTCNLLLGDQLRDG
jgi:hypothetical protein